MLTHALVGLDARRVEVEAHVELGQPGLHDRRARRPRLPGGEAPRAQRDRLGRALLARRPPDHGEPRACGPAQGGLRLRPSDRARDPRRVAPASRGPAGGPRRGRRARPRRPGPAGRRCARRRGGSEAGGPRAAALRRPSRRRRPRSPASSRCRSSTWPRRPRTFGARPSRRRTSRRANGDAPPGASRPRRRPRAGTRAARARARGRRRAQPAARRPARHRQDDAGPPAPGPAAAASAPTRRSRSTRIHSVAGLLAPEHPLVRDPPFRAPHHSASMAAIVGGGRAARPGEASAWLTGACCCSTSCPEFMRPALEALRQPLEDGVVSVARAEGRAVYPARFQLVGR